MDYEVRCDLKHAELCGSLKYETLSFTWGSEEDLKNITFAGMQIEVRNNLWRALRLYDIQTSDQLLWIDAMCIDQMDPAERRKPEVGTMSSVFSTARNVCVCGGSV